jgi:uncharacterized protein YprB with RNaseH-like and TPR domain
MRIFLDIETRCLAEECGGWGELKRGAGGISVAVTIAETDDVSVVRIWDDTTLPELASYLEAAEDVVTWNGFRFDIQVIENLLGRSLLLNNHRDLKMELKSQSLEKAGQQYVGRGKSGSGIDAPALLREGRIAALVQYCLDDVELLRDVFHATNGLDTTTQM